MEEERAYKMGDVKKIPERGGQADKHNENLGQGAIREEIGENWQATRKRRKGTYTS